MSSGPTGICATCGERIPAEALLAHLRDEHGIDAEVATWPDGDPVVVDQTLEPEDFA